MAFHEHASHAIFHVELARNPYIWGFGLEKKVSVGQIIMYFVFYMRIIGFLEYFYNMHVLKIKNQIPFL